MLQMRKQKLREGRQLGHVARWGPSQDLAHVVRQHRLPSEQHTGSLPGHLGERSSPPHSLPHSRIPAACTRHRACLGPKKQPESVQGLGLCAVPLRLQSPGLAQIERTYARALSSRAWAGVPPGCGDRILPSPPVRLATFHPYKMKW